MPGTPALTDTNHPGQRARPGLHGRRKGKPLRQHQTELVSETLPQLQALGPQGLVDLQTGFGFTPRALRVEIGFGGGEHLLGGAAANPDIAYIGCEPFINGVAKLLARMEEQGIRNVRVHAGDAVDVLRALPDASVEQVDLLYPDPWPKRRQRKRRFVSEDTIADLARIVKPGGRWRFATDIDDYAGWTLARVLRSQDFVWIAQTAADWLQPWADYTQTRYEQKAIAAGRRPAYLTFLRR
jgi:tRNA (guanine-N7-)-methyltransferase